MAVHDRPVGFLHRARGEQALGREQGGAAQRDHQAAGGASVQTMRQPWPVLAPRQQREPVLDAGAARRTGMDRQASGLVEHDEALVLEQNIER